MVGFANITEGYEVIQEAVASATEIENEKLMQRINYLNLCGQIAPMLGLLGTVKTCYYVLRDQLRISKPIIEVIIRMSYLAADYPEIQGFPLFYAESSSAKENQSRFCR